MGARGVAFGIAVGVALSLTTPLHAQGAGMTVDPALAKQGANLFVQRGCQGCHTIGKGKGAGPDLAGVFHRRSLDWIKHWLKAPDQMLTSDDPEVKRMLGATPGMGKSLHLDEKWAYNAIKQVGNYGEIFDRNVGKDSPLKLDRGVNGLWTNEGLMYAMPIR